MKKACLIVTIILLAVLMAGCENISDQQETGSNVVGYTADGRAIVELELGTGNGNNSRALHELVAQAIADYYEVIFVDNGDTGAAPPRTKKIYRIAWREGNVAKLAVPVGVTYDNTTGNNKGYAYIFAGRYSDKTLLGLGTIANLHGAGGSVIGGKTITTAVTEVSFAVEPLETNVNSTGTSTFKPTPFDTTTIPIDGRNIPVFKISNTVATPATFGASVTTTATLLTSQIIKVAGTPIGKSKPYLWTESSDVPMAVLTSVAFPSFPAADAALTFPINMSLVPDVAGGTLKPSQADPGLCLIYIDVPVYLYDKAVADSGSDYETWHFKGGLNNTLLDTGYAARSAGGAILLAVGPALDGGAGSIIIGRE